MTVYKILIYSITILLIGGAGYYFHLAGVPDLIVQNATGDRKASGVSAIEVFSGTYECDTDSGCNTVTRLILQDDTTLDIVGTIDGQDFSFGQGTWGIGNNGSLILLIQRKPDTATTSYPSSLIANKISSIKLAGFSTKKGLLPGMKNPIFTRVRTDTEQPSTTETTSLTPSASSEENN